MSWSDVLEAVKFGYEHVDLTMRFAYTFWLLLGGVYWYAEWFERLNELAYEEADRRIKAWNWPIAIYLAGLPGLVIYHISPYVFSRYDFSVFNEPAAKMVAVVGFAVLAYGLYCAAMGRASMNGLWTANIYEYVNPRRPDRLVTYGAYHFARHPIYQGQFLMAAGTALIANHSWVYTFPVFAALLIAARIRNEDRHLAKRFDKEFEEYKNIRPAFWTLPMPRRESRSWSRAVAERPAPPATRTA